MSVRLMGLRAWSDLLKPTLRGVPRLGSLSSHSNFAPLFPTSRAFVLSPPPRIPPTPVPPREDSHTSSSTPKSILAFLPTLRSAFSIASPTRGSRPYYGRGGAGGSGGGGKGQSSFRQKVDAIPSMYITFGIITINVAVLMSWNYGQQVYREFRDPRWLQFLNDNMLCSMRNFREGRIWTLVTSAFSHEGTGHFAMNMISLFFMAPAVMGLLGNTGFLALYLFGAVASTCTSLIMHQLLSPQIPYASHGASGAVYASITFFAACFPRTTFLLFFVVPVPAWLCVSGIFAWDLFNSFRSQRGKTDSAGHVGGVVAGLLWFLRKVGRI